MCIILCTHGVMHIGICICWLFFIFPMRIISNWRHHLLQRSAFVKKKLKKKKKKKVGGGTHTSTSIM